MYSLSRGYNIIQIEKDKLILCAASNNQKTIETASDICSVKFNSFKKHSKLLIKGIKFSEKAYNLIKNKNRMKNCKSNENKFFLKRFADSLEFLAKNDCRIILNYSEKDMSENLKACWKLYSDDLRLEISTISTIYPELYNGLANCVYKDPVLIPMMKKSFLYKSKIRIIIDLLRLK